jgi:hypothetical protein
MRSYPALVLVGLMALTMSTAQSGDVFIMGSGNDSCAKFVAAEEGQMLGKSLTMIQSRVSYVSDNFAYMSYALGVLTGFNLGRTTLADQIMSDNEAIELWLKNYCSKNPTDKFFIAISEFANAVTAKK